MGWWQQVCFGVEVLLSMMHLLAKHRLCFQCFQGCGLLQVGLKGSFSSKEVHLILLAP